MAIFAGQLKLLLGSALLLLACFSSNQYNTVHGLSLLPLMASTRTPLLPGRISFAPCASQKIQHLRGEPFPFSRPSSTSLFAALRDGSSGDDTPHNKPDNPMKVLSSPNKKKKVLALLTAVIICAVGFRQRQELLRLVTSLVDVNQLNQSLRGLLDKFNRAGSAGLVLYSAIFAVWTMTVGVTTPIETAAGFAFGAQRAIPANLCGKLGGALASFFLGRFIFYESVHKRLKDNAILQLVEESITDHPLLVAVMVRLLPLPEAVKNLGMSVLDIKSRYFCLSVLLHGVPFTVLWSCMGAETARVVTRGVAPSTTLKILVTGTTWFGVIVVPTLVGWWLKYLREKRAQRLAKAAAKHGDDDDA